MNANNLSADSYRLNTILQRHSVVEVMAFGSFARGTDLRPKSDIDLLVTYRPGTTLFEVADLQQELEEARGLPNGSIKKRVHFLHCYD